jgi:hypothetical protein
VDGAAAVDIPAKGLAERRRNERRWLVGFYSCWCCCWEKREEKEEEMKGKKEEE